MRLTHGLLEVFITAKNSVRDGGLSKHIRKLCHGTPEIKCKDLTSSGSCMQHKRKHAEHGATSHICLIYVRQILWS